MAKTQGRYVCGIDAAIDVVGGKWKPLILWALYEHGTLRFGALRREVTGITEKVLIQQLKEMEADGIVHREVYREVPPRVEYSMTELGTKLNAALLPLAGWGKTFMDEIVANKEKAEAEAASDQTEAAAPDQGGTAAAKRRARPTVRRGEVAKKPVELAIS